MSEQSFEPDIEEVLAYMELASNKTGKKIAYQHWYDFIRMAKKYSGELWRERVRLLMRSAVNVDFRYIDDYKDTCVAYGTIRIKDDKIVYVGIPKGKTTPKGKPFPDYPEPPERGEKTGGEPA